MTHRFLPVMFFVALSTALVSGCSWLAGPEDEYIGATLDDLEPAVMPDKEAEVPKVSLEEIEASYHRALEVAENDEVRRNILVRLAGLEMLRSEENQLDANAPGEYFNDAIAMYKELIELQEGQPGRDKLLYQLAKAYALDGRTEESAATLDRLAAEYPNSPYIAEAQFRRAERAFSNGNYEDAEDYYRAVADAEGKSPYQDNATYMLGWSQFKRSRYVDSLDTFTRVLDKTLKDHGDLERLTDPQRNLVNDTLRVMSLVFSYLDGPQTIYDTYAQEGNAQKGNAQSGERAYNHLLYQRLGDFYLEKERYRDSADTYQFYVDHYPTSDYAPQFSVSIIEVYEQGNFPSLLLPAKEDFIVNYGINSEYWAQKPPTVRDELRPHLHTYLTELAKYEHSQAQSYRDPNADDLSPEEVAELQAQAPEHYEKAARWYQEFVTTFPADPETPNMVFLLGEAYYESGQLAKAVRAYEDVAYRYVSEDHGAEAGYSAILAMDELAASAADPAARQQWLDQKMRSSITFADYYPDDERAPSVLAQGAQSLLAKGEYQQAVDAATRLTEWQPAVDNALLRTAWLVVGQSQFDLAKYAESEYAYRQVLAMMPAPQSGQQPVQSTDGPSRSEVIDRIAAAMFKQAEQMLAQEDKAGAINQLLQIKNVAPQSEIALNAQYDAATYLMELERWQEAERVLINFRNTYPNHSLTATLPSKLVVIYQELEQFQAAANELTLMAQNNDDPEVRRQSQYMAAELYEQSGNINNAILAYREYAETYSQPFGQLIEAQYKLVQLHEEAGNQRQRRYWLNRIITTDAQAGDKRNNRSKYLAAMASNEFAREQYQEFVDIPLKLPLKESLQRKRAALERTIDAYEQILDYGIAEYTTEANYRIGQVYVELSKALLNSERPDDLDDLAKQQYTILLEEQAYPFEERAIEVHESNARRSWEGVYDDWVQQSFSALARLLPARYGKQEDVVEYTDAIH